MPFLLRTLTSTAALATLAACGGSSGGAAPTAAKADAAAAAINLTAADVPSDFTGRPHDGSPEDKAGGKKLAACVGASDPTKGEVADVNSDDFTRGGQVQQQQVHSSVTVVTSASRARHDLAALNSSKTPDCLTALVRDLLAKQTGASSNVTFSTPTVTSLHPDTMGVTGTFGFSVSLTASAGAFQLPVTLSFFGALQGHTELTFDTSSIGTPLPAAQRDAMFRTLVGRLKHSAV